jgi:asparagine synthase (glutamine-hydrolysing)
LGTEHRELYIEPQQALAVIPKMPVIYDEPFSDPSQIPTFLVSQLAREHVKVALSGDGGDELFCGYNRYNLGHSLWKKFKFLPPSFRSIFASLISVAPSKQINCLQQILPARYRVSNLRDRLPKLAEVLSHNSGAKFYQELCSTHKEPEEIVLGSSEPVSINDLLDAGKNFDDLRNGMMCMDMLSYLPGDILTKVDRASMSLSLEARVPLLDHRLVEFAWRLPIEMKVKYGEGKWPLKQVLYKYVPKEMMERPKQGFGVPIEHWLRGPLKLWAEELLNESRLIDDGFFDPKPISKMWNELLSGQRRWHSKLWNILMFQAWFAEQ